MMTILAIALFGAALGLAALVLVETLLPALPRIAALLTQDERTTRSVPPVRAYAAGRGSRARQPLSGPISWREAA